ncbi:MAG TPA: phosphopantetheine-binding protein [Jatrophihabitans sp.]|nr:phosphopantetheine-binding protein [Jatrophihabitans sp.]
MESRQDFIDEEYVAPVGKMETSVAAIIADVLGVDRIGRTDSYYDFGGTSLQAIRICTRVEGQLGVKAVPLWLFENDVLEDFVRRLTEPAEGAGD